MRKKLKIMTKKRKANQIYIRRNNGYAAPNEFNMYNSLFPISFAYEIPSIQYNTFGFVRFINDSKFSIEGNFFEYKKQIPLLIEYILIQIKLVKEILVRIIDQNRTYS